MIGARRQRRVQVQAVGRTSRTDARLYTELIESDEHHRAVVFLGEPPSNESDYSRVPPASGQHQRRITVRIELLFDLFPCCQLNAFLKALPAAVELMDVFSQLLRPLARISGQQLDRQLCLTETTG